MSTEQRLNDSQITLGDVLSATHGTLIAQHSETFTSVGTDTRKALLGQLFIALKGDAYDAHNYLEDAVKAGATGLLVHQWPAHHHPLAQYVTIIQVPDTLEALQQLGNYRRTRWGKPIIAITGSNGKTTTKEFSAQILSSYKKVHYNQGSFNNHWGLPLTLLGLQPEHELAICEMGMNHPGEISDLVRIAQPNIVGITMVGRAHLEGLGSIESIAKAKEEIFSTPNPNFKTGIFNLDNPWTASMVKTYSDHQIQVLTFSSVHSKSDVHFQIASMDFDQLVLKGHIKGIEGSVEIPVFGQHNVTNLMFAACVGLAAGLSADQIWKGLANCRTTWGRNQRLTHPSGAEILFDGYNANPDSQKALIENLKLIRTDRPLVGVFGEMKELGANSEDLHQELGQMAGTADFAEVYFVGNYADNFKRGYSKTGKSPLHLFSAINTPMLEQISASLTKRPLITIKGSRGVRLEQILKYLSLI